MNCLDGQVLRKDIIEKLLVNTFGKEICEKQLSECAKDLKKWVSHLNIYQQVTSAVKEFNK